MHIVYLHQYFVTNAGSSGTRSYDMARQLVRRGHKVSLITGMLDHSELRCERSLWKKHEVDGIDVYASGAQDIAQSLGLPGQPDHPKVKQFEAQVASAVHAAGKKTHEDAYVLARSTDLILDAAKTFLRNN